MLLCPACNSSLVNNTFVFCIKMANIVLYLYPFLLFGWNLGLISFLLDKTIDVLLYVDRLDAYRVDNLDKLVAKAITESFGKGIWNKAIVALTHAQFSPPDGLPYEEFFSKRSEALLQVVRSGASINKVFVSVTSMLSMKYISR